MAAAASSVCALGAAAAAPSVGLGTQRVKAPDQVGKHACCSTRIRISLGWGAAGVPLDLSSSRRGFEFTSGSIFGDVSLMLLQHHRVLHAQASSSGGQFRAARASVGTVTKEPVTGIEFSNTLTPPGASTELSVVGAGVREKKIAFIKVKVYAVGFYIDASSLADSAVVGSWRGKCGSELSKDEGFFKALVEVPVEKALKIVLARDIEGSQFWGALDEALTPRLKTAGPAGQEALTALGNVFKDRPLKQGTTVLLTWSQPATLQIAISTAGGSSNSAGPDATIESAALLSSLFDVYLGEDPVSPSAKASIASGFPSLL